MLRQEEIERIANEVVAEMMGTRRPDSSRTTLAGNGAGAEEKTLTGVGGRVPTCAGGRILTGAGGRPEKKEADGAVVEQDFMKLEAAEKVPYQIADVEALERMLTKTTARIGVGKAGPRLRTETMLKLRADHAAARDAVLMGVNKELVKAQGLFAVTTKCPDKDTFLTRPDLGRDFDDETKKQIVANCEKNPDVQLIVSDGLSSSSVEANAFRLLPVVTDGLKAKGLRVGTPIFVEHGRVAAQDRISELLGAKVVCSFIGERPGLATAESLSAYISYKATVGMPEARRTVVSNIHKDGVPAVEAGAYVVDLIALILEKQASGVELQK